MTFGQESGHEYWCYRQKRRLQQVQNDHRHPDDRGIISVDGARTAIMRDMDLNRNQFFFLGVLILLLGVQVRMVRAYVLTSEATQFLAERTQSRTQAERTALSAAGSLQAIPGKTLEPPEWLGWCLISIGAVLILHSLAMPKPG